MIRNPIIHRELLSALRTRKAILLQVLFLLVTGALILLYWPAGGIQDVGGQEARRIFGVLALGEIVMVILFAPAFTAAALTSERERRTLESLFATAMRPRDIAVGKIVGSLGFLFLVILTGVPGLAMPFLLGGIEGTQFLAALGILLLTAVYLGMIGLLISAVMHRSYRAIITTYAILLGVCFLVAMPATPLSNHLINRGGPAWRGVLHVLASLSPLEAMLSAVWPGHAWSRGAPGWPAFWQLHLPLAGAVTLVSAGVCLHKLRRPAAPPRPRERLKVVERGQITARTFLFLIDPRKRKKMIRWWQNPMFIKEFRTRPMLQAQWLIRAFGWCVIISILLMIAQSVTVQAMLPDRPGTRIIEEDLPTVIAALSVLVLLLVGPAITGGTLCADREAGVWDLIRTTRLSSVRIVTGKFGAAIIPLLLLVMAILPTLVVLPFFVSFRVNLWPTILAVLSVVLMTALFVAAAGMFFSSLFSRTATATAWTYALVISLGLLTLLMLLGEGRFSQRIIAGAFVVSPLAAALDAAGSAAMIKYQVRTPHLQLMAVATVAMFLVAVVRVIQLRRPDR